MAQRLLASRVSRSVSLSACESSGILHVQRRWSSDKKVEADDWLPRRASSPKDNDPQQNSGSLREKRKKTPLDDFFANLGSSTTTSKKPPRRMFGKQHDNPKLEPMEGSLLGTEQASTKELNMSSFFDEVNKIMANNKEESEKTAKGGMREGQARPATDGSPGPLQEKRKKTPFDDFFADLTAKGGMEKGQARSSPDGSPDGSLVPPSTSHSILDLLPPNRIRRPNAYDEEPFEQYSDILDMIITRWSTNARGRLDDEKKKKVEQWLRAEEPVIKYSLPTLENIFDGDNPVQLDEETMREVLREEMRVQHSAFQEHHQWNKKQYEYAGKLLSTVGDMCAKKAIGPPAEIAWEKWKEAGFTLNKNMLENYVYVTATFCSRPTTMRPLKGWSVLGFLDDGLTKEPDHMEELGDTMVDKKADVATEIAICHDIMFGASEQTTLTRVRDLVSQGNPMAAERLLERNASDELRFRTYDPVFQCYLEQNDLPSALQLYVKMKSGDAVSMRPEAYIQLISGIAEKGFFQSQSPPIDGAESLGYPSGPKLFDRLAEELALDALEISAAAAKRLYNALLKGFEIQTLRPLHVLQSLEICNVPAEPSELVASRVSLDTNTGQCPRTGVRLRLIDLDDEQKERLQEGLHHLAVTAYKERNDKGGSMGETNLRRFGDWLATRRDKPFTAIVDGPNVGYYFQNFDEGSFNFYQIQFVVDALENMGENVLVILPAKYTQKSFMVAKASGMRRHSLTKGEQQIFRRLVSSGKAYIVPPSFLDDYYWMYASVCGQGEKWTSDQQYVPPNNADGRWPGMRPMLVSNDKMRDHKLSLLEPRPFRRWYSNFLVNFTFSAFVGDQCVDREIGFSTADFYSREIQGNSVQDEHGGDLGTVWHFPVSDWDENESFCVRIPLK